MRDRVSSLPSATLMRGLAVDDRPNRARDREDLPFGELDLDRMPERVLDREARMLGLAGRMGRLEVDVSGDSSTVGDRVFRTSSEGIEILREGWSAAPSCCEVMDWTKVVLSYNLVDM